MSTEDDKCLFKKRYDFFIIFPPASSLINNNASHASSHLHSDAVRVSKGSYQKLVSVTEIVPEIERVSKEAFH